MLNDLWWSNKSSFQEISDEEGSALAQRIELTDRRTLMRLVLGASTMALARPRMAKASEITTPIEALNTGLLEIMKMGKAAPFQQRYDHLAPRVIAAFDLDSILQNAVGAAWGVMPANQQAALRAAFERYSVASYVTNFDEFNGERFEISPPAAGNDTTVKVKIVPGPSGGEIHTLGYVMQKNANNWKTVDVIADGIISQGAVQKAEIRAVLAFSGATGLLARLQEKANDLSQ